MDMVIRISRKALEEIRKSLGSRYYETGGLLGSNNKDVIDTFFFDEGRVESTIEYFPYVELWQKQLAAWETTKITFRGIIHSHVSNDRLSDRDMNMAREIIKINSLQSILMPIYLINRQEIIWYEVGLNYVKNREYKAAI